jgi:hypothetical protein
MSYPGATYSGSRLRQQGHQAYPLCVHHPLPHGVLYHHGLDRHVYLQDHQGPLHLHRRLPHLGHHLHCRPRHCPLPLRHLHPLGKPTGLGKLHGFTLQMSTLAGTRVWPHCTNQGGCPKSPDGTLCVGSKDCWPQGATQRDVVLECMEQ